MIQWFMTLGRSGNAATPVPAFDDTKVFTLKEQYRVSGRYLFTGTYSKNPITGNVLHTFFNGSKHIFEVGKKASARRSTDNGATHSAMFDIAFPAANWGIQDVAHGYSANGHCHLFWDEHEGHIANVGHKIFYKYSDDDGATWSAAVDLGPPPNGHKTIRVIGNVVESNGVLLKPYYSFLDEGSALTESARYVLRSTDGGASWQHVLVEQTAEYINEGSVIAVGDTWIYGVRRETGTRGWRFYKSTDKGLTWTAQGNTQFGESTMNQSHPLHLEKFRIEGVDILACYYVNRDTKEYKVIYGRASDVINGLSGWNINTKLTILNHGDYNAFGTPTFISGYGCFFHVNNTLEAKGVSFVEYSQTTATNVLYFDMPTTHYQSLKTQLGIGVEDVFWVVGDSIANGTNNRTGESKPNPNGALLEWDGSSFVAVSDTATANDGTQYPQFAITHKQATGKNTYLVESAVGGAEFYPNGDNLNWYTSGTLYEAGKTSLEGALTTPNTQLKGVILILGINDARSTNNMLDIKTGMDSLITRINTDFNTPPIYIVQIGRSESTTDGGFPPRVRDVQKLIDNTVAEHVFNDGQVYGTGLVQRYANVELADALEPYVGLGYYGPDNLHLNQAGNNYLGTRLSNYINGVAS